MRSTSVHTSRTASLVRATVPLLFMTMLLLLGGCATPVPDDPALARIDTSRPVPVALLVPGGSGQASDEALARSLENAARLAMADLDGVQIDLRVYNTAGQAERAGALAAEAVANGAKIILGPVYAPNAAAAGSAGKASSPCSPSLRR